MLSILLAVALTGDQTAKKTVSDICEFTQADKDMNALLSFEDFDQNFEKQKNWRGLSNAGCMQQALEASQDYAVRGPVLEPYHQRIMLFHYGQTLAIMGREAEAAPFISFSREPKGSRPPENKLNWNDYVTGTWAFLSHDRALLITMRDNVLQSPGQGNQINGNVLAKLEKCFGQPYTIAYSTSSNCQKK